jgi:hypothetical protein
MILWFRIKANKKGQKCLTKYKDYETIMTGTKGETYNDIVKRLIDFYTKHHTVTGQKV